jgi:15-cis-phytoene synthase
MTVNACAVLVERGDPDRFLAIMAAPPDARVVLFPLAAFNIEVARAPWATREPLIAQMRLQWWQDAVEEIAAGQPPRKHEVVGPLAEVMQGLPLAPFKALIAARQWDIYTEPFADLPEFLTHMDQTAGGLSWLSALALGADPRHESLIRGVGVAAGIANWLTAAPELAARGKVPLVDDSDAALVSLADHGLALIEAAKTTAFGPAIPALRCCWRAPALLRQVKADPSRVAAGTLGTSEFQRRASLMGRAFSGRW